jgi:hypothetical protein
VKVINAILLIFVLITYSCKKEEIKNCGCGLIIEKQKTFKSIKVRNHCTLNDTIFYLDTQTLNIINKGDEYCPYKSW